MDASGKLKIGVYSGDQDSCVPYLGTMSRLESMNFVGKSTAFRAWRTLDSTTNTTQIAGYQKQYGMITFQKIVFETQLWK